MISTGIVSVTFRKLKPHEIVSLAVKAKLDGIEWGGDIHVPHGDIKKALEIGKITADAGLVTASYGSYYSAGRGNIDGISFEKVVDTAAALRTDTIRVWAGDKASRDADDAWRGNVIGDTARIAEIAKKAGMTVAFEYHAGTLADSSDSVIKIIEATGADNVKSYWQPPVALSFQEQINGLEQIKKMLCNIHVFWWDKEQRMPLICGMDKWIRFIDVIKNTDSDHFCMLEFVKDDDPGQFLDDARVLKKLVAG